MKISLSNDGEHSSTLNFTIHVAVAIERIKVAARIMMPRDPQDKEYQRQFFQTTIDVNNLLAGIEGSFVIKAVMENLIPSFDKIPSFPIAAVRNHVSSSKLLQIFFSQGGESRIVNLSISDKFIPPFVPSTKGAVILRFLAKVPGKKAYVTCSTMKFYGEYKRPV